MILNRFLVLALACSTSLSFVLPCAAAPAAKSSPAKLVAWKQIEDATSEYIAGLTDHKPGDIVTRSEMTPLFERLTRLGWSVPDKDKLLAQLPADDDFLVTTLRTRSGRRFMREVSKYPDAYDRLDRMSRMERGKRRVQDLIGTVRGDEVIEFLTTTDNGREIGGRLSTAPRGKGFNRPTGRIYTAESLLAALKTTYDRQLQGQVR